MYYSEEEEEMVFCPYNRYHIVSKLHLHKHIIKCKKQHSDVELATCFYNYSHRLKPEDMLKHYEVCSQKTRIDGSRYYCERIKGASGKSDPFLDNFPDISVKPKFLENPDMFPAPSDLTSGDDKEKVVLDSESEEVAEKKLNGTQLPHRNYINGDCAVLEPLPLPKTASKAFQCMFDNQPELTQLKGFGRGKNFISFSPPKHSRSTDHLLPDLCREEHGDLPNRTKIFKPFPKDTSCSESITSSMFDDATTLRSEDVIFDEDLQENCNVDEDLQENGNVDVYGNGLNCIDLDNYKKI